MKPNLIIRTDENHCIFIPYWATIISVDVKAMDDGDYNHDRRYEITISASNIEDYVDAYKFEFGPFYLDEEVMEFDNNNLQINGKNCDAKYIMADVDCCISKCLTDQLLLDIDCCISADEDLRIPKFNERLQKFLSHYRPLKDIIKSYLPKQLEG